MNEWESVVAWLHKHQSRNIVIRAAGYHDDDGNWHPREHSATFVLTTRLPDGRKVQSSVSVLDEVMVEPVSGDMIVHHAKQAIECMLSKEHPPESK